MTKNRRQFDSEKLLQRTKESQRRSKSKGIGVLDPKKAKDFTTFNPGPGKHLGDIIPYFAGKNDPEPGVDTYTFEYYIHKEVGPGQEWVTCPLATIGIGKPCPICEYRQRLRDRGDERYKKFFPKRRNLYNWVPLDRNDPNRGRVTIWDVPYFYFEKHLASISEDIDQSTGDTNTIVFSSPKKREGRSISFEIEGAKSADDYDDYLGHGFKRRTDDIEKKLLKDARVLDELIVVLNYEELEEKFFASSKKDRDDENQSSSSSDDNDPPEEEIEDLDDFDEVEDFIEDNDLEDRLPKTRKLKRMWKKDEEEVKDLLREAIDEPDEPDDDDEGEEKITEDDVLDMSKKEIKKLIKEKKLSIDTEDFDDLDDLKDEVLDKLHL